MIGRMRGAVLAVVVAMTAAVAPLQAQEPQAQQPPATAGEAAVTEMAWPTDAAGGVQMSHDKPKSFEGRLMAWLACGAVIHFPIALMLTAGADEVGRPPAPLFNAGPHRRWRAAPRGSGAKWLS